MADYLNIGCLKAFPFKLPPSLILIALIYSAGFSIESTPDETPQTLFSQATSLLAEGDSTGALGLLDKALELDPKHWEAYLERGRLHLDSGDRDAARNDFLHALSSKFPEIKAKAHIGLGDIYLRRAKRAMQAITEYRQALRADPASREAYFALFQAGWKIGPNKGYRIASQALVWLICLDPCFRDVYTVWRDTIKDKTEDELRSACTCLEKYVAENPEKSTWLFDLAGYRYWLDEIDKALENLARLEQACPEYRIPERLLLRARCLLELEEISGFERSYYEALEAAKKEGDFTRLVLEAEPIFNPTESKKAGECQTAQDWDVFFRKFWKRRDPDPLTFHNERLVEHYRRLRKAEKFYPVFNPYPSRFNTSNDYYRLISLKLGFGIRETGPSDYDPDLFWNRSRELGLGQRGLLLLRHGPPDEIRLPEPPASGPPPSAEVWRYGPAFFPFEKIFGAGGEYLFIPLYIRGLGNVEKAMETESFRDPLPALNQDFYGADFLASDGKLELEFYQSLPFSAAPLESPPTADIALFDTTWKELDRNYAAAEKIRTGGDNFWIAVNRLNSDPGKRIFTVKMNIPGHRVVQRNAILLRPYHRKILQLSGVILGSPPKKEQQVHSRRGVNILPRPSLKFITDEIITVYFEVYGLEADPDGRRSFTERVTVSLIKEDKSELARMLDVINPWDKKSSASLRMTFNRQVPGTDGPVAEHFTIDPSELVPGNYSLFIEVLDNIRQAALTACFFDLAVKE